MKYIHILIILSIIISLINMSSPSSSGKYNEIEYRQRIISKYNKSLTLFSIKFIKSKNIIEAIYQKGFAKFEIDPNTFSLIDKTTEEGLKKFELSYDELSLMPKEELFKNFDKINFPKDNNNYNNAEFPDFPIWHIIVDGKDYQGNVDTDFYIKFNNLIDIKKIENYVISKYNN